MIGAYFVRDREALLTDIEMMAEAKEVSSVFYYVYIYNYIT